MSGALSIVIVNVSQTVAEAPLTLQRTGALVSTGATTTTPGSISIPITQLSDLTGILTGAIAISSITWSSSVVTVTTATAHGIPAGQTIEGTIAGVTPSAYNGTFACTETGTNTFTYPLASNPGSETVLGTFTLADVSELVAMATTYFAQASGGPAIYVFECGELAPTQAVAALSTFIADNIYNGWDPNNIIPYSYLVPREWDANSAFLSLIASYEATTSKVYFWVTTTTGTYTTYTNRMKCVNALIEAPGIAITEFSQASAFWVSLMYNPSPTNQVTPFQYTFVAGVTPYPTKGTQSLRTTLKAANISIIGQGYQGGIVNTLLLWGNMLDGNPWNYWYAVDWVSINVQEDLANEVINGSNDPQAPLDYDQNGINRLQARAQQTMNNGVTYGIILAPVTVTAIPFAIYVKTNPQDYPEGVYNGIACTFTPQRGFSQIIFNAQVTNFPAG